jgi:hypothetical protein
MLGSEKWQNQSWTNNAKYLFDIENFWKEEKIDCLIQVYSFLY